MDDEADSEKIFYSVSEMKQRLPEPGVAYNHPFQDLATVDFWMYAAVAGSIGNSADRAVLLVLRRLSAESKRGGSVVTEADAITVARRAAERRLEQRGFPPLGANDIAGVRVISRGPGRWEVLMSGPAIIITVRVDRFEPKRRGIGNQVAILRHPALQVEREEERRQAKEWRERIVADFEAAISLKEPPPQPDNSAH